jgi:carboxyl-terminal processing protease
MPDVFVPLDTAERSHYVNELIYRGLIKDFALEYADANGDKLRREGFDQFRKSFVVDDAMLHILMTYAQNSKLKPEPLQLERCRDFLCNYIKATLARILWNEENFYMIYNSKDKTLQRAILEAEKK